MGTTAALFSSTRGTTLFSGHGFSVAAVGPLVGKIALEQVAGQVSGQLGEQALSLLDRVQADRIGFVQVVVQVLSLVWATASGWDLGPVGAAVTLFLPVGGPVWAGLVPVGTTARGLRRCGRAAGAVVGVAAISTGIVLSGSVSATAATTGSQVRASGTVVRAGSFNVRSVQNDSRRMANEAPWAERREVVVGQILGENLDVVGIQEASQNPKYASHLASRSAENQYMDLLAGLNGAGGSYGVTNTVPGESRSTRIFYNKARVSLVRSGTYTYDAQSGGANDTRYLVWAVFETNASHSEFLFTNTHLANGSKVDLQKNQWREMLNKVQDLQGDLPGDLPVISVGDFQRSKMKNPASDMMTAMKSAGIGDVVGQKPLDINLTAPRPETLSQQWVNSTNQFNRNVIDWCFEKKSATKAGNNADWIFASNNLPIKSWEVVANIDWSTYKLQGVIPSDHNLVVAGIQLPSGS